MYNLKIYNDSGVIIYNGLFQDLKELYRTIDGFILYENDKIIIEKFGEN